MRFDAYVKDIDKFEQYVKYIGELNNEWIFRGCKLDIKVKNSSINKKIESSKKENAKKISEDIKEQQNEYFEQILKSSFDEFIGRWPINNSKINKRCLEAEIIRDFQRRYSISYNPERPPENDLLSWLSLMRHHGAPTRLLDFSYSPYMALFFAFDSLFKSSTKVCAVCAINLKWFEKIINIVDKKMINDINGNKTASFMSLFYTSPKKNICLSSNSI
jgi:hypothetical protein